MGPRKRFLPSPSMVVALAALVVAICGVAVAAIPGPDGVIHACYAKQDFLKQLTSPVAQTTAVATPAGTMRVVEAGQACAGGEAALTFNQKGLAGPAGAGPKMPTVRAASSAKAVHLSDKVTPLLAKTLPAGAYLVTGNVRLDATKTLKRDQLVRCYLVGPDGKTITSSVVTQTLPADQPGLEVTIPLTAYIKEMPAGKLTLDCKEQFVAGGGGARAAGVLSDGFGGEVDAVVGDGTMSAQEVEG